MACGTNKPLALWGVLLAVASASIGVGISYGVMNTTVGANSRRIEDSEERIKDIENILRVQIPAIREELVEIRTILKSSIK